MMVAVGGLKRDTQIGGNATVPSFKVLEAEVIQKG